MSNINDIVKYTQTLNLLFVEDNKEAREMTIMLFEDFFHTIIAADNGQDAFDKFVSHDIDLIITDINMPKLSGLEMIEKIREIDKHIPILVLSAHNESHFFTESEKLGIDGYILKPIHMEQFLDVLRSMTQKLND